MVGGGSASQLTRVDGGWCGVQGSKQRATSECGNGDGNIGGDGGGDGPSMVRHAAAQTGLRWCGTVTPDIIRQHSVTPRNHSGLSQHSKPHTRVT